MEYRQLGNTDMKVSVLSYGASPLGNVFRRVPEAEGIAAVHTALDLGINFIDVSPYYGLTVAETVLGKALKGIPRDSYYLATKVGRYGDNLEDFDFSAGRVTTSVDERLGRLGVDYLDIIQCHDIEFGDLNQVVEETIPALRELQAQGKGPLRGDYRPAPERFHRRGRPRRNRHHSLLLPLRTERYRAGRSGTVFQAERTSALSTPRRWGWACSRSEACPTGTPASDEIKRLCAEAAAHCRAKNVDIAQLAIRFSIANPDMATTLVGTANPKNV